LNSGRTFLGYDAKSTIQWNVLTVILTYKKYPPKKVCLYLCKFKYLSNGNSDRF